MIYTIKDLKEGKVILQNSNANKCKKILKKVFNVEMKSYEYPAFMYFYSDNSIDGYNCVDIIKRDAPHLKHLPIQKSEKFKI